MMNSFKKSTYHFREGFSALELLAVIAILGIIVTLTYTSFASLRRGKNLDTETLSVLSLLEKARADTLGAKGASQYGVHFETTKAVFFSGGTYVSGNASNITMILNPLIQISSINLTGGGAEVIFDRLSGKTEEAGTLTLSLVSASSSKTIAIGATGLPEIQ
ncbi:MAG: prepilin-type N-terminal cleavage/methylation domain-containing protein [Candidatus Pacebacteria bacterium]|nr:prepilin-type N-terminal cleavage/methylation domain-containing protein [Candidatus Paceibacterota bacterium]